MTFHSSTLWTSSTSWFGYFNRSSGNIGFVELLRPTAAGAALVIVGAISAYLTKPTGREEYRLFFHSREYRDTSTGDQNTIIMPPIYERDIGASLPLPSPPEISIFSSILLDVASRRELKRLFVNVNDTVDVGGIGGVGRSVNVDQEWLYDEL